MLINFGTYKNDFHQHYARLLHKSIIYAYILQKTTSSEEPGGTQLSPDALWCYGTTCDLLCALQAHSQYSISMQYLSYGTKITVKVTSLTHSLNHSGLNPSSLMIDSSFILTGQAGILVCGFIHSLTHSLIHNELNLSGLIYGLCV